jgi:L-asparagine transporter-like permease
MAYSLPTRGEEPASGSRTTSRGVPSRAIIASTAVGFLGVVGNYVLPVEIFGDLLTTAGAIALFVHIVIALSQLRMRQELNAAGVQPAVRTWAFPALSWLTIAFIVGVLPDHGNPARSTTRALVQPCPRRRDRRHGCGQPPEQVTADHREHCGRRCAGDGAPTE